MNAVTDLPSFRHWLTEAQPRLAFAGPDPHYALGLDLLAPAVRIACAEETPACAVLRDRGVAVWTPPEGELGRTADALPAPGDSDPTPADDARRSALAVLEDPRAAAFVGDAGVAVVAFKTSHALERMAADHGWRLLAAPAALGRRWENKVAFRELAAAAGVPQPDGLALDLADADYATLAARLGPTLVLQAAHGYAGNRTLRIASASDLRAAQASLRARRVRVAAWVEGVPMTLNACATARGIAVGAPFEQVTGLPALTPYPLGSCGQRWVDRVRGEAAMVAIAQRLGDALIAAGYRGFFGVDFVVTADGAAYAIEVNPRLVASVAAYTQLELLAGRLPLLARHLVAWLEPEADCASLDAHRRPLTGGQLVLHNVTGGAARLESALAAGIYRLADGGALTFLRPGCHLADVRADDEALLLPASTSLPIPAAAAWARVQAGVPLTSPGGALLPGAEVLVAALQACLTPF